MQVYLGRIMQIVENPNWHHNLGKSPRLSADEIQLRSASTRRQQKISNGKESSRKVVWRTIETKKRRLGKRISSRVRRSLSSALHQAASKIRTEARSNRLQALPPCWTGQTPETGSSNEMFLASFAELVERRQVRQTTKVALEQRHRRRTPPLL